MPATSWPIWSPPACSLARTAQHNQAAQPQQRQPPTSFSFRQKPSKGYAVYLYLHSKHKADRSEPPKTATKQEHNLHQIPSAFSASLLSCCPAFSAVIRRHAVREEHEKRRRRHRRPRAAQRNRARFGASSRPFRLIKSTSMGINRWTCCSSTQKSACFSSCCFRH